jgi:hypothetical protein
MFFFISQMLDFWISSESSALLNFSALLFALSDIHTAILSIHHTGACLGPLICFQGISSRQQAVVWLRKDLDLLVSHHTLA